MMQDLCHVSIGQQPKIEALFTGHEDFQEASRRRHSCLALRKAEYNYDQGLGRHQFPNLLELIRLQGEFQSVYH
jgi:hypothetical protein